MQRRIARRIKRFCRGAHVHRKIRVTKDSAIIDEDIVPFVPTNTFIFRLITTIMESPTLKETLSVQAKVLQHLDSID